MFLLASLATSFFAFGDKYLITFKDKASFQETQRRALKIRSRGFLETKKVKEFMGVSAHSIQFLDGLGVVIVDIEDSHSLDVLKRHPEIIVEKDRSIPAPKPLYQPDRRGYVVSSPAPRVSDESPQEFKVPPPDRPGAWTTWRSLRHGRQREVKMQRFSCWTRH